MNTNNNKMNIIDVIDNFVLKKSNNVVDNLIVYELYDDITGTIIQKYKSNIDWTVRRKKYIKSKLRKSIKDFITIYSTKQFEMLNKSDTLVIHCKDKTTDMLSQVYENKGWDVIRNGNIDINLLHKLLNSHKKIVMLGHGTSGGLINSQKGNYIISSREAEYLRDKPLFVIWCNADDFFNHQNLGKGMFITGNMPSDFHEAAWVGYNVSQRYMDENITYWCKLCGDVCERALNGDANGAVEYVRSEYWKKYGNSENKDEVGITKYNYDRTKVQ